MFGGLNLILHTIPVSIYDFASIWLRVRVHQTRWGFSIGGNGDTQWEFEPNTKVKQTWTYACDTHTQLELHLGTRICQNEKIINRIHIAQTHTPGSIEYWCFGIFNHMAVIQEIFAFV